MRAVLGLLMVVATFAACGGDDGGSGGGGGSASSSACPSDAVTIDMVDIKFKPEKATASVGDEVCWVNEDSVDHNAVATEGASFKSDLYGKGQTFTAKLDQPGTVKYECTIHPGMTGEIDVSG